MEGILEEGTVDELRRATATTGADGLNDRDLGFVGRVERLIAGRVKLQDHLLEVGLEDVELVDGEDGAMLARRKGG